MNLNRSSVAGLAQSVVGIAQQAESAGKAVNIVICPSNIYLADVLQVIENTPVSLGAQDCRAEDQGAFTGDVSAAMMRDIGVDYVLVGHSERRKYHHENNALVRSKAESVMRHGMTPVICIGETEEERQSGRFEDVIATQLAESVPESVSSTGAYVLAYEPVWAIGTGKTASVEDIAAMHLFIHDWIGRNRVDQNGQTCILYGGSVKAANAVEILGIEHVGGVLVGGASLDVTEFEAIAQSHKA